MWKEIIWYNFGGIDKHTFTKVPTVVAYQIPKPLCRIRDRKCEQGL